MPKFVVQRSLYEVRERPSKAYSWAAFLIANVLNILFRSLIGLFMFVAGYQQACVYRVSKTSTCPSRRACRSSSRSGYPRSSACSRQPRAGTRRQATPPDTWSAVPCWSSPTDWGTASGMSRRHRSTSSPRASTQGSWVGSRSGSGGRVFAGTPMRSSVLNGPNSRPYECQGPGLPHRETAPSRE